VADRFISRPALFWLAAGLGIEDPENVMSIHCEPDRVEVVRLDRPVRLDDSGQVFVQREVIRVGYRAEAGEGLDIDE
jgi:hypothetical protein